MEEHKIRTVFVDEPDGTIFLLRTTQVDYDKAIMSLLKAAVHEDIPVIYVGAKLPYVHLRKKLREQHVSEDRIFVVDAITKTITDDGAVEAPNVRYLNSPQNLTNLATSISLMADKADSDRAVLIVDSLESLLTYNVESDVSRFLEDLDDRARTLELDIVLFKKDDELDEKIGSSLYEVVDETVLVSKEGTEQVVVAEQGRDKAVVEIPADVARALHWEQGDELSFDISDMTLELNKE